MKMTITTTALAGADGPDERPEPGEAGEAGRLWRGDDDRSGDVPFGVGAVPRSVWMSSRPSLSFSTVPPLLAPRTSAIFARMFER